MLSQGLKIKLAFLPLTAIAGLVAGCTSSSRGSARMSDSDDRTSQVAMRTSLHDDNRGIASMGDRGEEAPARTAAVNGDRPVSGVTTIMPASNPPPLTPAEVPAHEPHDPEFWVPGHWQAESGQYVWVGGRIEHYRSGTLFHPAKWNLTDRGWEFTPEFWQ